MRHIPCPFLVLPYLIVRLQMGIYATLGVGQAFAGFLNGTIIALIVYSASRRLHHVSSPALGILLSTQNLEGRH